MTVTRYKEDYVFGCDQCDEILETKYDKFEDAWEEAKERGWVARKLDGQWVHYCPDCKGDLQ